MLTSLTWTYIDGTVLENSFVAIVLSSSPDLGVGGSEVPGNGPFF